MLIFLGPGVVYIIYYFWIAIIYPSAEHRIKYNITIGEFFNNCFIVFCRDAYFNP